MTNSGRERGWLVLYKQALLEPDRTKLKALVAQAQHAIRKRAHELWYAGTTETTERRELETALRFLGLLLTIGTRSKKRPVENMLG